MNKRIFRAMFLLILITVVIFIAFAFVLTSQFDSEIKSGMTTLRVTIVNLQGDVVFDNRADEAQMDNHLDRPEIIDAIKNGHGESERYSDTLLETTRYYALKLDDNNIIRLAMTTSSTRAMLYQFIPVAIICVIVAVVVSFFVARRFANRIIKPINDIDFDNPEIDSYDELLPFVKKIKTQNDEIERQMMELESRSDTIKEITENMQEGLLLVDKEGVVILANKSVLNILGETDAIGKPIVNICRDPIFSDSIENCLAGKNVEISMNRNKRIYQVFFGSVEKGEIKGGATILFIDITEKYSAEQHRKEFSANVSHELKTPLTTIVAISEMLSQGSVNTEDIPQFGGKINMQSQRLVAIIDDIVRLSEFDEGRVNNEFEMFSLNTLAEDIIFEFKEKAAERNISLGISADENIQMYGEKRMIEELLCNLVDNAIKYNKENGFVSIALCKSQHEISISVEDNGIGIPQDKTRRIFERFYRVDNSRSKKTGGTGLGLSIAKHIVEYHNGKIEVESVEEKGTKITCNFSK